MCTTLLCCYDSGESVVLELEIVQQTTKKINMIQEKMKALQSCHKRYHDKRRKTLEFQEGDHVLLRVTMVNVVGLAMKYEKLTPCFIGPFQILQRV